MNEEFDCLDCRTNTLGNNEYYMLQHNLWEQIHPEIDGMLCIGCVEKRLDRKLGEEDFLDCPANHFFPQRYYSSRLWNRLGR